MISSIVNAVFSYCYAAFVGISSAFMFFLALILKLITHAFDKRLILLNLFSSFWASMYIWCMPNWTVKIYGRDKLDMSKSYVMVSNHQSQLDILLLYRLFFPFRWISKADVFKIPFIGWNMILNGYVRLKRGDKKSIQLMMKECETLLKKNVSILLFPEGTRSKDGRLRPFKPGAFILAQKMKKSIQPLVINNTCDALPKHTFRLRKKNVMTLTVLDEIKYHQFSELTVDQTSEMVRDKIKARVTLHQE